MRELSDACIPSAPPPVSPTHTCGCPTKEGAWECLWKVRGGQQSGYLCRLFVPPLPSVSSIFSSWPVRQESFVEGARERASWACVCWGVVGASPLWVYRPLPETDWRLVMGQGGKPFPLCGDEDNGDDDGVSCQWSEHSPTPSPSLHPLIPGGRYH